MLTMSRVTPPKFVLELFSGGEGWKVFEGYFSPRIKNLPCYHKQITIFWKKTSSQKYRNNNIITRQKKVFPCPSPNRPPCLVLFEIKPWLSYKGIIQETRKDVSICLQKDFYT